MIKEEPEEEAAPRMNDINVANSEVSEGGQSFFDNDFV